MAKSEERSLPGMVGQNQKLGAQNRMEGDSQAEQKGWL